MKRLTSFFTACCLLVPATAEAQQVGDMVDLRDLEVYDEQQSFVSNKRRAAIALESYANCIVGSRSGEASARGYIMRTGWKSARRSRVTDSEVNVADCMPENGRLELEEPLLSRALSTALYVKHFASGAPEAMVVGDVLPAEYSAEGEALDKALAIRAFGNCVVASQPAEAHAFVMSEPETRDSRRAHKPLKKTLASCVNTDRKLRFSRPILRGILAEALLKAREAAE